MDALLRIIVVCNTHTRCGSGGRRGNRAASPSVDHLYCSAHPYSEFHTRAAFGLDAAMDPAVFFPIIAAHNMHLYSSEDQNCWNAEARNGILLTFSL
jgi:hypothetical protein